MSVFVSIVNLDGAPLDPALLTRLTDFVAYAGPDAQDTWMRGPVGLGHALLRTTFESQAERQPFSRDGRTWIVADARLDAREELLARFQADSRARLRDAPDVEWILEAYEAWGEECVLRLVGDFAFVIWDARRQELFCARDHFGVKPFYYSIAGETLIVSNVLNCIRQAPGVSSDLNDSAIGDFILVGYNAEPTTTTFADIRRLPPAHTLALSNRELSISRYWTLPTDGHIRYKRPQDYVEHFRQLFFAAVGDRLRVDGVAVPMSGGMDSTSVAAVAHRQLKQEGSRVGVHAVTTVYERAFHDSEGAYARMVAGSLGFPVRLVPADDLRLFEIWRDPSYHPPEPWNEPVRLGLANDRAMAEFSRVQLSGYGGDPLLYPGISYAGELWRARKIGLLTSNLISFIFSQRRLPPLYLRSALSGKRTSRLGLEYPAWLNREFEQRCKMRERWAELDAVQDSSHPHREAYQALTSPFWQGVFFERGHPGASGVPLENRYPFFDVRLVNFVLAIPPLPWCTRKLILREAMQGILPEGVRRRPKTLLAGNPHTWRLNQDGDGYQGALSTITPVAKYVDRDGVQRTLNGLEENDSAIAFVMNLRPFSLAYWLQQQTSHN